MGFTSSPEFMPAIMYEFVVVAGQEACEFRVGHPVCVFAARAPWPHILLTQSNGLYHRITAPKS